VVVAFVRDKDSARDEAWHDRVELTLVHAVEHHARDVVQHEHPGRSQSGTYQRAFPWSQPDSGKPSAAAERPPAGIQPSQ